MTKLLGLKWFAFYFLLALCFFGCKEKIIPLYESREISIDAERAVEVAAQVREEVAVEVADGLQLSLWASDSLVADPIAISVDELGRIFYTSATRQSNSEFDIRGHRNWMTASISFQTVEDRRAFLRETFSSNNEEGEQFLKDLNKDGTLDWRDLAVEKEQVWFVEDASGNGVADKAKLYLEDFNEEITDVANGIEYNHGDVFIAVGPDMWRTKDRDKDGVADEKELLSHGYAVHIGFSGHGMSGAVVGPDGRIWWGIGDIGMNVVDKEGKNWKYPNRGVIARSERDGSNFEVYCHGVRNTHEFVFDKYGNLISEDNDGDHSGERERLVYLINGSDTGWRINWQFGKYTDPDNNGYKVWMDEKMHTPSWEGQAAYFLPPITNFINGPTGFVYNPGTALSPEWYDHFFVSEFRGSPANSPIHAFTLTPKGASFELNEHKQLVKGLLPTGLDFGPDGALYFGDWIDGWGTKEAGRIWKVDVTDNTSSAIRKETKQLIEADFKSITLGDLEKYLGHQDMRVRQKAQFELVDRGDDGFDLMKKVMLEGQDQLARIHSIWGVAQLARTKDLNKGKILLQCLSDKDPEIITQAAKMLGDIRFNTAGNDLIPLLKNPSLRVQLHATEALGRIAFQEAFSPVLEMLVTNAGEDKWLRHAGMIALSRIGDENALEALKDHQSGEARLAAVVALRRLESPKVASFLLDEDELIVTESARAINDDFSIPSALPDLAKVLESDRFTNEALLRRAINANLRVGTELALQRLIDFSKNDSAPSAMRAEAIATISTWAKPSVFDRVDGRYRGEVERDPTPVKALLAQEIPALLNDPDVAIKVASINAAGKLNVKETSSTLLTLLRSHGNEQVRAAAMASIAKLDVAALSEALKIGLSDKDKSVRSVALEIIPEAKLEEKNAVELLSKILIKGTTVEQQTALSVIADFNGDTANEVLSTQLSKLSQGKLDPAIQLDVIEAIEKQGNEALLTRLSAYQDAKPGDDPLSPYIEALEGGNAQRGRQVFYGNEAAQCVRCHAIFEYGGNAGPGLANVGNRLTKKQLLTAIVAPSAEFAAGYAVVSLKLQNDETVAGIVQDETDEVIQLKIGTGELREIEKSSIQKRTNVPSSMPPMGSILKKSEIRDLVKFLSQLKE